MCPGVTQRMVRSALTVCSKSALKVSANVRNRRGWEVSETTSLPGSRCARLSPSAGSESAMRTRARSGRTNSGRANSTTGPPISLQKRQISSGTLFKQSERASICAITGQNWVGIAVVDHRCHRCYAAHPPIPKHNIPSSPPMAPPIHHTSIAPRRSIQTRQHVKSSIWPDFPHLGKALRPTHSE